VATKISIDPEELQTAANDLDQQAQNLKETVVSSLQRMLTTIENLSSEGQAATKYRERFEATATSIQTDIETLSDEVLADIRNDLTAMGLKFQDLDSSFAF
jgi:uncharacterized protein YukE